MLKSILTKLGVIGIVIVVFYCIVKCSKVFLYLIMALGCIAFLFMLAMAFYALYKWIIQKDKGDNIGLLVFFLVLAIFAFVLIAQMFFIK